METLDSLFTRSDYQRLPEGFPAQLIHGWLVKEPSPLYGHQRAAARIRQALVALVGPDLVPDSPVDVAIDDHNVYQPDVAVLRRAPPLESHEVGIPLLVVEVLSRSSRYTDRFVKVERYLAAGVAEVWLVDPEAGEIEVRSVRETRARRGAEVLESEALPGFVLVPSEVLGPR
jgi:Uma2 family endonuclease